MIVQGYDRKSSVAVWGFGWVVSSVPLVPSVYRTRYVLAEDRELDSLNLGREVDLEAQVRVVRVPAEARGG